MSEPLIPIPVLPETKDPHTTGEGAQTALAAMIRKRKMGENHIDVTADPAPKPPAAAS